MTVGTAPGPGQPARETDEQNKKRRALGVACAGHVLHDGYTDLIWVALPIWQAEFALSYAAVGTLRMIYSGTMAGLQIPAARVAERLGEARCWRLARLCAAYATPWSASGTASGGWWRFCFWAALEPQPSTRSARRW
jgi:hypothetical protein